MNELNLLRAIFGSRLHRRAFRKHIAWDYGIYSNRTRSNAVKTKCGTFVSRDMIDNDSPTCTVCLARMVTCFKEVHQAEG